MQPDGAPLLTYSIVTRDAIRVPADTHPRMPLLVAPEMQDQWLHPGVEGDAELVGQVMVASEDLSHNVELSLPPAPTATALF